METHGPYVHSQGSRARRSDDRTGSEKARAPDVALEKLHALEITDEGVYETNVAALLPDNESNLSIALDEGAVEDALSAVEDQKDQVTATETASTISEKPTSFAKKAKKKSASLLDDDQPMLNFGADDEVEQDAGNAETLEDAVDQRDELREDGDIWSGSFSRRIRGRRACR